MPLPRASTRTEADGDSLRQKMVALVDPIAVAVEALQALGGGQCNWILPRRRAGSRNGVGQGQVTGGRSHHGVQGHSGGGGVVVFGPGTYDVGDLPVTFPNWDTTGKSMVLKGAHYLLTVLKFSVDRGLGTFAISGDGTASNNNFGIIEDMAILGPGVLGAINTSPANMDGVRLDTQMKMNRVAISLFRSGLVSVGNHSSVRESFVQDCYYNLYFTVAYGNGGDIILDNVRLSTARRASIAIADTIATFTMNKGHMGFAPYGMLFEANTAGTLTFGGAQFFGTSFEFAGNSWFHSIGQVARVQGLQFFQCGTFSRNDSFKITSEAYNPAIFVKDWTDCEFFGGMPSAYTDGGVFDVSDNLSFRADNWYGPFTSSSPTYPFVKGPANSGATQVGLDELGTTKAFAAQAAPVSAITAGQVLEWDAYNRVRPYGHYGAAKGVLTGIALNSVAAGSRNYVIVLTRGRNTQVLSDGGPAAAYLLVPSTSTAGKASGLSYDGTSTKPIIGPSYGGTAVPTTAATVGCDVVIG